jgi:hypothetical protein
MKIEQSAHGIVINAEDGETCRVAGKDLSSMVGKTVKVTGTLEEGRAGKTITVTAVE